jgi:hypothetical protein
LRLTALKVWDMQSKNQLFMVELYIHGK